MFSWFGARVIVGVTFRILVEISALRKDLSVCVEKISAFSM